jgi:8-oxo-dGTP diphosphatase
MKKPAGAGIILINSKNHILLILRDDDPTIPYPNMWDLPGGHLEEGETPEQAIRREMKEELDFDLGEIVLFKEYHHEAYDEYVFLKKIDLNPDSMVLHEGQRLAYFNSDEISRLSLAYSYNRVLRDYFDSYHFRRSEI